MADINIEKKKNNTPIWPWILGALLLIGAIWAIAEMGGDDDREEVAVAEEQYREDDPIVREPQSNRMAAGTAAAGFVSYVNDNDIKDRIAEDHNVTSEALMRLSAALEGLSQNDGTYSQQIEEIRQNAQAITSDQTSQQHADKVKSSFTTASNVLAQIRMNQYPDVAESEVEDLQEKSREIDSNKLLTDQKDEVEDFFEKAADAIEKMDEKSAETMENRESTETTF